jgi:hypothetical protein
VFRWFEIAESVRRLSLSCMLVLFYPNSVYQILMGIFICYTIIRSYAYFDPYLEAPITCSPR